MKSEKRKKSNCAKIYTMYFAYSEIVHKKINNLREKSLINTKKNTKNHKKWSKKKICLRFV